MNYKLVSFLPYSLLQSDLFYHKTSLYKFILAKAFLFFVCILTSNVKDKTTSSLDRPGSLSSDISIFDRDVCCGLEKTEDITRLALH